MLIDAHSRSNTVYIYYTPYIPTVHSSFLQLYCQAEPSDCPTGCTVVDFRVSEWHCYHCHCPGKLQLGLYLNLRFKRIKTFQHKISDCFIKYVSLTFNFIKEVKY